LKPPVRRVGFCRCRAFLVVDDEASWKRGVERSPDVPEHEPSSSSTTRPHGSKSMPSAVAPFDVNAAA